MSRRVFITVAELSGDKHAGKLISELKAIDPSIIVEGLGGQSMRQAGAIVHHDTVSRAAMGLRALGRAFEVRRLLKWTREHFRSHPPDLQICIDSWTMNKYFARLARSRGIKVMYYIAPQVWASREGRVKEMRRFVDRLACIHLFEEEYFRRRGINATFVGHPLFDEMRPHGKPDPRTRFPNAPAVIGILPGSRKGVAKNNFPHQLAAAMRIRQVFPETKFLIPTTPATHDVVVRMTMAVMGAAAVETIDAPQKIAAAGSDAATAHGAASPVVAATDAGGVTADSASAAVEVSGANQVAASSIVAPTITPILPAAGRIGPFEFRFGGFDELVPRCDLCLTVSGTATLHTAGYGVPMIVVYRGNPILWHLIGRWVIKTRTYSLVNLLSDSHEHIVPEYVPWYGNVEPVAQRAIEYLHHPETLALQAHKLRRLVRTLDKPGASRNAARMAMEMMGQTMPAADAAPAPVNVSERVDPVEH